MATWHTRLEPLPQGVRLLVTGPAGEDLLKAQLASSPEHPRALLTVLEGLALWCAEPLCVAISADVPFHHSLGLGPFDDPPHWPQASALVRYTYLGTPPRARRIRGVGDFRRLRQLVLLP
jgi:hypothetical protein